MKCNQSRPGFELVLPCPFPTTITITPRAAPKILCSYNCLDLYHTSSFDLFMPFISTSFSYFFLFLWLDTAAEIQKSSRIYFYSPFFRSYVTLIHISSLWTSGIFFRYPPRQCELFFYISSLPSNIFLTHSVSINWDILSIDIAFSNQSFCSTPMELPTANSIYPC